MVTSRVAELAAAQLTLQVEFADRCRCGAAEVTSWSLRRGSRSRTAPTHAAIGQNRRRVLARRVE